MSHLVNINRELATWKHDKFSEEKKLLQKKKKEEKNSSELKYL